MSTPSKPPAEYRRKLVYRPGEGGHTLKIGDRITFTAPCRHGPPRATRIVNGFDHAGRVTVRHHGWRNFVVQSHEIERFEARK